MVQGVKGREGELYRFHEGSVKISGTTKAGPAGRYAANLWRKGKRPVDLVYLGGNAGRQADKSAHVMVKELFTLFDTMVAFIPIRVMVKTDPDDQGRSGVKDAFIWRAIPLDQEAKV